MLLGLSPRAVQVLRCRKGRSGLSTLTLLRYRCELDRRPIRPEIPGDPWYKHRKLIGQRQPAARKRHERATHKAAIISRIPTKAAPKNNAEESASSGSPSSPDRAIWCTMT